MSDSGNGAAKPKRKVRRLFVTEYESAFEWTDRGKISILSSIDKDNDLYLIFHSGKNVSPPPTCVDIMDQMGANKVDYECDGLPDDDYRKYIVQEISRYSDENTSVIFLSMDGLYRELKPFIEGVDDVRSCQTFNRPGRKRVKAKEKTVMSNPKKTKEARPAESDNADIFEALSMSINPGIKVPDEADDSAETDDVAIIRREMERQRKAVSESGMESHTEAGGIEHEEKEHTTAQSAPKSDNVPRQDNIPTPEKRESADEPDSSFLKTDADKADGINKDGDTDGEKPDSTGENKMSGTPRERKIPDFKDSVKGSKTVSKPAFHGSGEKDGTDREPIPQSQGAQGRPQQRSQQGRKFQQGGRPSPQQPVQNNMSLQEIEKMIFGAKSAEVSFDKVYTELDIDKMNAVTGFTNRLIDKINKLSKNAISYDMSYGQYVKLITMLAKSDDYEDFVKSWDVAEAGLPLGINEDIYKILYQGARHYAEICRQMYDDDPWM